MIERLTFDIDQIKQMDKKSKFIKIRGGFLTVFGYLLSPASWYNDLFVNIPLAYLFAVPFGFISEKLFTPFMILGYWLTNIAGFVLMHYGVKTVATNKKSAYARKEITKDVLISILYTLFVVLLIKVGWLKFPIEYFTQTRR